MRKSVRRASLALAAAMTAATVAIVVPATPAAAHVTVVADEAVAGERARVVFRVPNEGETPTTRLEVHLQPEGAPPIPSARPVPVSGWEVEVTVVELDEPIAGAHGEAVTEAASVITWTAEDESAGIPTDQLGEFPVVIGPLPDAEELYFPTLQTYAGVEEPVRWISRPDPGGEEPPDPAPVLQLAPGQSVPEPDEEAAGEDPGGEAGDSDAAEDDDSGSGSAGIWLGLAGLVAGLAGLAAGGLALWRTRAAGASGD